MARRKRTEEDPISNRPFWASFISPLASVRGGVKMAEKRRFEIPVTF